MTKSLITKLALCAAIAVSSGATLGCRADVHDNTADVHDNTANIDDAAIEFNADVDVDAIQPSESVHVSVTAENVFLVEPDQEPPPDRVMVAGHFQFYLDTTSSEPLLITASKSVDVPIPSTATPGDHKLICRVHKHDGSPTSATFEISIKVSGSVTTGGQAGSGSTTDTNAGTSG
jgi:hypothetical protein